MLVSSSTSSLVRHPAPAKPGMSGVLITEPVAIRKDLAVTVSADPVKALDVEGGLIDECGSAPKEIEISLLPAVRAGSRRIPRSTGVFGQ